MDLVLLEGTYMEEDYEEKIIELVKHIKNLKLLKLIYNFVNAAYKEEKAGS